MKFTRYFLCFLLFLVILSSCDQERVLNLPEIEKLHIDILDTIPEIDRIFSVYGNSGMVSITIYYGEHHQQITGEDAFFIVQKIRDLFIQEEFQDALLITTCSTNRADVLAQRCGAVTVTISILDSYRPTETGRYRYFFESHFFSDEDSSNAGKGHTYDGYSTWTGYRCDTNTLDKEQLTVDVNGARIVT